MFVLVQKWIEPHSGKTGFSHMQKQRLKSASWSPRSWSAPKILQPLFILNLNFKSLAIFSGCTARFVSDLVGNPKDRFSQNEAQLKLLPLLSCHTRHLESSPRLNMSLNVNTSNWSFSKGLLFVSDFLRWICPESPFIPNSMTKTLASVPAPLTLEVFTLIL